MYECLLLFRVATVVSAQMDIKRNAGSEVSRQCGQGMYVGRQQGTLMSLQRVSGDL